MYSIYDDLVYQLEHEGAVCASCGATALWRPGESLLRPRCPDCSEVEGEPLEARAEPSAASR